MSRSFQWCTSRYSTFLIQLHYSTLTYECIYPTRFSMSTRTTHVLRCAPRAHHPLTPLTPAHLRYTIPVTTILTQLYLIQTRPVTYGAHPVTYSCTSPTRFRFAPCARVTEHHIPETYRTGHTTVKLAPVVLINEGFSICVAVVF